MCIKNPREVTTKREEGYKLFFNKGADPKKLDMKQCDKLTSSGTSNMIKFSRGGPKWPSATHLNSSFKSSWKS